MSASSIAEIGFVLVIFGFVLALVAVILLMVRAGSDGAKARGAGILLIGPIPIIFGTDRGSVKALVVLAVILIAVVFVFMLLPSLLTR
jgi:uncharacterized protein (TIGR00304 family)